MNRRVCWNGAVPPNFNWGPRNGSDIHCWVAVSVVVSGTSAVGVVHRRVCIGFGGHLGSGSSRNYAPGVCVTPSVGVFIVIGVGVVMVGGVGVVAWVVLICVFVACVVGHEGVVGGVNVIGLVDIGVSFNHKSISVSDGWR